MMRKTVIGGLMLALLASCTQTNDTAKFTGHWIEDMPNDRHIIQGMTLDADGLASSIGMATLVYEKWKVDNGRMILWGKSLGNGQTIEFADTMEVVKISTDTMILSRKVITGTVTYIPTTYIRTDSTKEFNPLDSLTLRPDLGAVETRCFEGVLPAADCPGIDYKLWIYNQLHSGDGVYKLSMTYLEAENGRDVNYTTYGRMFTLRGSAADNNATLYQLVSFDASDITNYLFLGDRLEMLDRESQKIESQLNYTLTLQK